jgi:hypothetical protein
LPFVCTTPGAGRTGIASPANEGKQQDKAYWNPQRRCQAHW